MPSTALVITKQGSQKRARVSSGSANQPPAKRSQTDRKKIVEKDDRAMAAHIYLHLSKSVVETVRFEGELVRDRVTKLDENVGNGRIGNTVWQSIIRDWGSAICCLALLSHQGHRQSVSDELVEILWRDR